MGCLAEAVADTTGADMVAAAMIVVDTLLAVATVVAIEAAVEEDTLLTSRVPTVLALLHRCLALMLVL